MATKTPAEARLAIHETITTVLVALAIDDRSTPEQIADYVQDMGDIATMIMSRIGLNVTSVEDGEKLSGSLTFSID